MSQSGRYTPSISPGTYVETLTGNSGGAVGASSAGNINVVGDGTTIDVVGNPGTNTLTISVEGIVATSFDGDTGTAAPSLGVLNIITGYSTQNCGSSVLFSASGSTVTLNVTDSSNNTIIGKSAGNGSISGTNNTGIGYDVLAVVAGGASNTAIGCYAGSLISSGVSNTIIGASAADSLTSGSNITAVGTSSLGNSLTGSYNSCFGGFSGGNYNSSESSNICIGYNVAGTAAESHVCRIGNATGTSAGNLESVYLQGVYGNSAGPVAQDGVMLIQSSGLIACTASGTSGQVLTSNGSGSAPTFQNASSGGITILDADSGSATGTTVTISGGSTGLTTTASSATMDLTGTLIVAHGGTGDTSFTAYAPVCGGTTTTGVLQSASTGFTNSGYVLTSTGGSSLPSWQAAGINSLTITTDSGTVHPSGGGMTVTAINGYDSCGSSVSFSGSGSTLVLNVTDANDNTIFGLGAGGAGLVTGQYNQSFGYATLYNFTSGIGNVMMGYVSGYAVTSGSFNTGIGYGAFTTTNVGLTSGSCNTAIGGRAGYLYTSSESSNILIGYATGVNGESNTLRIGNGTGTSSDGNINAAYISGIYGGGTTPSDQDGVMLIDADGLIACTAPGTSGYVLTSNGSGSAPTFQPASGGSGFTWNNVTLGAAAMVAQNGYLSNSSSLTTLTMPTSGSLGDTIKVVGVGTGGWSIIYTTSQYIIFGTSTTTATTGNLSSTNTSDCIEMVCTAASITAPIFTVVSSVGNITVA